MNANPGSCEKLPGLPKKRSGELMARATVTAIYDRLEALGPEKSCAHPRLSDYGAASSAPLHKIAEK